MSEIVARGIVPSKILQLLSGRMDGTVLMNNTSGTYFQIGSDVVLLCDLRWGCIPIGISIENHSAIAKEFDFTPGSGVSFQEGKLLYGGKKLTVSLESWQEPETDCKPETRCCRAALELLQQRAKPDSFATLANHLIFGYDECGSNPYCTAAAEALKGLISGLQISDETAIERSLAKLLGLGRGLTPAGDDVVHGLIRSLQYCGEPSGKILGELTEKVCCEYTNLISCAYLKTAQTEPFLRGWMLWQMLCGRQELDLDVILEIGNSSGSEILLGFLLGIYISEQKIFGGCYERADHS